MHGLFQPAMLLLFHAIWQTMVGLADVAEDALRVCPMPSGLGFADPCNIYCT